jgi:hypothetical protein
MNALLKGRFQIAMRGLAGCKVLNVRLKGFFREDLRDVDFHRLARSKRKKARRSGATVKDLRDVDQRPGGAVKSVIDREMKSLKIQVIEK